jgi:hypothetical protein
MPDISDDAWIDLCCMLETTGYYRDCAWFYFQYDLEEGERHNATLIYNLRVAVRAVGHKITNIHYTLCDNETFQLEITTSIPRDEWQVAKVLYENWCKETKTNHNHHSDSEYSESESESDSESETEENPTN